MPYNPKIHHRRSIRLKGYDYAQPGAYFITICTNEMECPFGHVENDEMILNPNGQIAYDEWLRTPQIRPNISLDVFEIMPNHMHGIIIINESPAIHRGESPTAGRGELNSPGAMPGGQELNSPQPNPAFRSPSKTVGSIVRGYKSAVTNQINLLGNNEPVWQRDYYEHIIRNEKSYQRISDYIVNNAKNWKQDKFCR
jgi:putative transposase